MKTVLFVEDDPFLIDIYSTKLKESGFNLKIAKSGEECLSKLENEVPDILILDIILPKINGWEVLEKIRKNRKFNHMKIIVFSNLGQRREIERALKLGATEYLIKAHYTPSQMVKEIQNV